MAGCGGGEDTPNAGSSTTSTAADPGPPSQDEIYNACIGQLAETSVHSDLAQATCAQARALYSDCLIAASETQGDRHDRAIAACEREAKKGLAELAESAPG
jgi:hypothetical protein